MSLLLFLLALWAALVAGWRVWRRVRYFLHVFQLEGYKRNEYAVWRRKHRWDRVLAPSQGVGAAVVAATAALPVLAAPGALVWAFAFASDGRYTSTREKKPLAFTDRMKRLARTAAVLTALPVLAGAVAFFGLGPAAGMAALLGGFLLADVGAPWLVAGAGALLEPVERRVQEGFKAQARQKLQARPDLTVIGITGSYGKTSVKFIVAEILRQKYHVLATPSSYNTPMGICLVINNQLKPEHQVLVLEMGMRYRHDIQELCAIAPPDVAMVTTVGPAHLDTIGTIENIALEKGDIVRYAKPGAVVVLNGDNAYTRPMDALATGPVWKAALDHPDGAQITARDLAYGPDGATFTVRDETGDEQAFATKLLGAHNVLNILLGVAVGRQMGLRLRQIAHAVRRLEPVPHRLALRAEGPITVIDDAFNANPTGARNAVDILAQFTSGRRALVTPGMVELGDRQYAENFAFGQHIADRDLDLVLLVGPKQTLPIQDGLRDRGFPPARVQVVKSLFAARDVLQTWQQPGDVVLYENDLPDHYDEG